MTFEEKTISSEVIYKGPVFQIRKHRVETRSGESVRDIVEHSGGAIMVAVTDEGKVLAVRQYRKALEKVLLELPAGKADPGETPEITAARELAEETGYTPAEVRHLTSFYPTCGYSNEFLHIYLCRGLTKGDTHWDDSECMDILEYDPDDLIDMIMKGEVEDSKTIIGILFARQAGEI